MIKIKRKKFHINVINVLVSNQMIIKIMSNNKINSLKNLQFKANYIIKYLNIYLKMTKKIIMNPLMTKNHNNNKKNKLKKMIINLKLHLMMILIFSNMMKKNSIKSIVKEIYLNKVNVIHFLLEILSQKSYHHLHIKNCK
jgi:hypothetical protein